MKNPKNSLYLIAAWVIILSIFMAIFGGSATSQKPLIYKNVVFAASNATFFVAAYFCCKNYFAQFTGSGKLSWLLIGLSWASFGIGNMIFQLWEIVLGLNPSGSPADIMFSLFYIFLVSGISIIVFTRKLYPSKRQIPILAASIVASVIITASLSSGTDQLSDKISDASPLWAIAIDKIFKPYNFIFLRMYAFFDILLFSTAVNIAACCWKGIMRKPWMINAAALAALYVSDSWLLYSNKFLSDYQTGYWLEIGWVISAAGFSASAILERQAGEVLLNSSRIDEQ
jgi:hypothetical protein